MALHRDGVIMVVKGKQGSKKASKRKPVRRVTQNYTEKLEWNEHLERAALLVAQDSLSDEKIADELGISRKTLHNWKTDAAFVERVNQIVAEIQEKIVARGIAEKQNRIDALNRRHKLMEEVIGARAKNLSSVPGGGKTGLLVRQVKGIGKGEQFQVIEEYAVDTGLLKEMREHEKQAAIEVGQWSEKHELTGKNGGVIEFTITPGAGKHVSDDN
jgi:hypothetical protein